MARTVAQIREHNKQEAAKFKLYIRLIPKVMILYSADAALAGVMSPAYTSGSKGGGGSKMVHSTSNAAYNWRISFGDPEPARDFRDKDPVGWSPENYPSFGMPYEGRSSNASGTQNMIDEVITSRREQDINRKLYGKLFRKSNLSMPAPKVILYNNIETLGWRDYVKNANVANAAKQLKSYAMSGQQIGIEVAKNFMQSGTGRSPNAKGLLDHLSKAQGGNFVSWI